MRGSTTGMARRLMQALGQWNARSATHMPPAVAAPLEQLPASYLQRLGIRTHGRTRLSTKMPPSLLRRSLKAVGATAGLAAIGLPLAGIAALVVTGREDADAIEIVRSLPRTARVVWWGTWAACEASIGRSGLWCSCPNCRGLSQLCYCWLEGPAFVAPTCASAYISLIIDSHHVHQ
jgi:hypothetical protein